MPWRAGVSRNSELYEVYVNGVREATAFEADISRGWALCYVLNAEGNVDIDVFGVRKTVLKTGRVEIRKVNR
jgi:hypothetical protein